MAPKLKDTLTTKQAAKLLKTTPQHIRDAINDGIVKAFRRGGRYQIPQRQMEQIAKIRGQLAKVGHFVSVKVPSEADAKVSHFRLATIIAVKSLEEIVVEFVDNGKQRTVSTQMVTVQPNMPTHRYRWPNA